MATITRLRQLGLADGLIEHLRQPGNSPLLAFRCQLPAHYASSPIAKCPIEALWECGTMLVYFHNERLRFEKCSLENINEVWASYSSLQGALADLFIDLYEDEATVEELKAAADQVGFHHVDRLISEAENQGNYAAWRDSFPKSCEG